MNLLFGTIVEQDLGSQQHKYRVRLATSELSPWITALLLFAGSQRHNQALSVNTQVVLVLSDYEGIILGAINDVNHPATNDRDTVNRTVFDDGAVLEYDSVKHQLSAVLPAGGSVNLMSDGGITLVGDITLTGKITASGDVVAGGISLINHIHPGDSGGSTGAPL